MLTRKQVFDILYKKKGEGRSKRTEHLYNHLIKHFGIESDENIMTRLKAFNLITNSATLFIHGLISVAARLNVFRKKMKAGLTSPLILRPNSTRLKAMTKILTINNQVRQRVEAEHAVALK
jgi:hypothetical protein